MSFDWIRAIGIVSHAFPSIDINDETMVTFLALYELAFNLPPDRVSKVDSGAWVEESERVIQGELDIMRLDPMVKQDE